MCIQKISHFFLAFIGICLLLLAGCSAEKETTFPGREVTLEEYDLSPVFLSPPNDSDIREASHNFHYTNDSDEDIVLSVESSSCGCTRVKITPEKLAPGESATIAIAFDLAYSYETRSEYVIVKTNQETPRYTAYKLSAVTFPQLELKRADYNEIVCDPGKSKTLTVLCRTYRLKSEEHPGLIRLESSSNLLVIHPSAITASESLIGDVIVVESRYELDVFSPSPETPEYNSNGYSATLTLMNDKYQVDETVIWKPRQYIDSDKTSVFFNFRADTIENERIVLKSNEPFSITSVQIKDGLCEVRYDSQRSELHRIEVSPTEKSLSDDNLANKDVIILSTDHPLQPQIRFNVHFLLPLQE